VARVLATRPQLVLLDEVMGGLNPTESDEVIALVLKLRKNGLTFVVIEHDMRAIMRISDRVVVLDAGEKLAEGTPAQVVGNREVVAAYLGEAP
jgi:branched-chain amino acid transport system ATP-binding protein